jgi:GNAT superfamily N-acetyltransferase
MVFAIWGDAKMSHPDKSLELERVPSPSSPLFSVCLEILGDSIPASEQMPRERLTKLLARDEYRLYAFRSALEVAAFAMLYLSRIQPIVLLDYMAVRGDLRGQGIGSALFREVVTLARRERPTARLLLLEVDDDREGTDEERQTNQKRIEFYRRLGARLLANVPYRFPSAGAAPVPMRLMVLPLHPEAALSPFDLRLAIEDIFFEVHRRDANDPLLGWIIAQEPSELILD